MLRSGVASTLGLQIAMPHAESPRSTLGFESPPGSPPSAGRAKNGASGIAATTAVVTALNADRRKARHSWALQLTRSRSFTLGMAGVIVVNSVLIGVETDLGDDSIGWYLMEVLFTTTFLAEWLLRIYGERSAFLSDGWNLFDTCLVMLACVDTFALEFLARGTSQATDLISVLRVARVARLVRLLRMLRKLWQLVVGLVNAMRALIWAWILIAIIIYVFAIVMTRMLGHVYTAEPQIQELFGSVPQSMFTLFAVMTLEGWPDVARLAMHCEPWMTLIFVFFLIVTTYSLLNVIIAVIVESTMEQAGSERSEEVKQQEAEMRISAQKVEEIWRITDSNGDGHIGRQEWHESLNKEKVRNCLREVGFDVRQAVNIFDILDFDDSGSLSEQEFVRGVLKARGEAKAKHVLAIQCQLWRTTTTLRQELLNLCVEVDTRMQAVDAQIDMLREDIRLLAKKIGPGVSFGAGVRPAPASTKVEGDESIASLRRAWGPDEQCA